MKEQDLRLLGLIQWWEGIPGCLLFGSGFIWLFLLLCGSLCMYRQYGGILGILFIFFWTSLLLRTTLEREAVSSFAHTSESCLQHFL